MMAGDTKERILKIALELFAEKGYLGTSMSDIANRLGITKGALYKHYTGKQEILDSIVERMNQMYYERAQEYEMPETQPDGFAEAYLLEMVDFIDCIQKDRKPELTVYDGTKATIVTYAITDSFHSGKAVKVEY